LYYLTKEKSKNEFKHFETFDPFGMSTTCIFLLHIYCER